MSHSDLGEALRALEEHRKSSAPDRRREPLLLSRLGSALMQAGRLPEAAAACEQAIEIAREVSHYDLPFHLQGLALVRATMGDGDAAAAHYREALELETYPTAVSVARIFLAEHLLRLRRHGDAVEVFAGEPHTPLERVVRAACLEWVGKRDESRAEITRAHFSAIGYIARGGHPGELWEAVPRIAEPKAAAYVAMESVIAASVHGRWEDFDRRWRSAAGRLRHLPDGHREEQRSHLRLARVRWHLAIGEPRRALSYLSRLVAEEGGYPLHAIHTARGIWSLRSSDLVRAAAHLDLARECVPRPWDDWFTSAGPCTTLFHGLVDAGGASASVDAYRRFIDAWRQNWKEKSGFEAPPLVGERDWPDWSLA